MLTDSIHPIHGIFEHFRGATNGAGSAPDLIGLLAALYESNERLFAELKSLRRQMDDARAYLLSPGNNPLLGQARLAQLRNKHSASLAVLRANRIRAREFCGRAAAPPLAV